jgi:hypothetical protein
VLHSWLPPALGRFTFNYRIAHGKVAKIWAQISAFARTTGERHGESAVGSRVRTIQYIAKICAYRSPSAGAEPSSINLIDTMSKHFCIPA